MVVHSEVEELVEVKVVLHQEANVARLELHRRVTQDLRVGPHIDVEGTRRVGLASLVPFEAADANLKSIHASAIVLELLVAVLCLIKAVSLVLEADGKATKFRVDRDEVCGKNRLNDEVKAAREVVN